MGEPIHDYDTLYRDQRPPWEIGGPQPALVPVVEREVRGPRVLDVGCGTGELAIALARRGFDVTGVDASGVAIEKARAKATAAGLTVRFEVRDATAPGLAAGPFDSVFDSGLLHNLHRLPDDSEARYLALLPGLAAPRARLFVLAISVKAGQGWGLTEEYLRAEFAEPEWVGTTVEEVAVRAVVDGEPLSLPACLVRSQRAA